MEEYNYNFEIRRCILHFLSALDGGVVKRYDKNQNALDSIKVNYVFGPKERIMMDLVNATEHTKLPVVSISLTSVKRDASRVKETEIGRYESELEYNKNSIYEISPPVPVNLTFDVTLISKYQSDMEQMISNFISYSNPYFIVSWREPHTNKDLRSEVLWGGTVNLDYPKELQGKEPYSKLTATTSFEFKSWIFKSKVRDVGKICEINSSFTITDKWFCDYDNLLSYSEDLEKEEFTIDGLPKVEWVNPTVIKTGNTVSACSSVLTNDDDEYGLFGRTSQIELIGKFINITDIFLSASDPNMLVNNEMSSIDIFESDQYPKFNGFLLKSFKVPSNFSSLIIDVPKLSGDGRLDVIVVNPCGYSKLSEDKKILLPLDENPYNPSHELYNTWISIQDPFVGGIEVIDTQLTCVFPTTSVNFLGTIEGKILKTLEDRYIVEM